MRGITNEELEKAGFVIQPDNAAGIIAILYVPGTTVYYLPYYHRVDALWLGVIGNDIKDMTALRDCIKEHTSYDISQLNKQDETKRSD